MKIEIEKAIGVVKLDIIKLKEEIKKELPFKAIMNSFEVVDFPELEDYEDGDKKWFEHIYAEIDWGLFWRILDKHPDKKELLIKIHPVEIEGQPILKKKSMDVTKGIIELEPSESSRKKDWMLIGEKTIVDKDAWIDTFVKQRLYDPIHSDWQEIKI